MTRVPKLVNPYFTDDQSACLLDFAAGVVGSRSAIRGVTYHILGIADLAKREDAASLLKSLQSQDWAAAAQHNELAGENDLLVAILLHIEADAQQPQAYWVAMRSPFDYLDSASLLTYGKIVHAPEVSMSVLPLENALGKKS